MLKWFWNLKTSGMGCMYSTNLESIFDSVSIWEKTVFSSIFIVFYKFLHVISCFTCTYWGIWIFFINIVYVQDPKNISSKRNKILKILNQFVFDLKTLIPVSKSKSYTCLNHKLIKTNWHNCPIFCQMTYQFKIRLSSNP